jgi:hypothetical protein
MLVGVDVPIDGLSQWAGMAAEAAVKLGKAMTPIALEAGQERVEKKTAEEKHKALVEKVLNDNSDVGKEELVENPTSMPIAPMKNTEFFIDILLLIRSLQVGAALSRVLEDKSALAAPAPLSNAERVNISACRLLLPDALNSPRMALALHATSKPFTDAAARFLLRGGVSAASEAGIAFMTGGISLFVSASLKAAKGPTAGSLVSDIIIDSPTTSRNMAMVNFFHQQFDQIAQELAPFYEALGVQRGHHTGEDCGHFLGAALQSQNGLPRSEEQELVGHGPAVGEGRRLWHFAARLRIMGRACPRLGQGDQRHVLPRQHRLRSQGGVLRRRVLR